jgi:integrase
MENTPAGTPPARATLSTLNPEQLTLLEAALEATNPVIATAARLMGRLGLRVGEVHGLRWKHIAVRAGIAPQLTITQEITKTGYARTLPLTGQLAHTIGNYRERQWQDHETGTAHQLHHNSPDCFDEEPVIAHRTGAPYAIRTFQWAIGRASTSALGYKIKPHALRHSFATNLLRHTNTRVVQSALGHRSLRSTQIYTHPSMQDLREALEKTETATP